MKALLVLIAVVTHNVSAQELDVRKAAPEILQTLIEQGIPQVGAFRLHDVLKDIAKVEYISFPFGYPVGSGGMRPGAVNVKGKVYVYLQDLAAAGPVIARIELLHEALEAACYEDEPYHRSLGFSWLLAETREERIRLLHNVDFLNLFSDASKSHCPRVYQMARGGGVTGTGGGGDRSIIALKFDLLKTAKGRNRKDLYPAILTARIERLAHDNKLDYIPHDLAANLKFSKDEKGTDVIYYSEVLDRLSDVRGEALAAIIANLQSRRSK